MSNRVALIQADEERLSNPAFDLASWLGNEPSIRVEHFSERNIEGFTGAAEDFDSAIIGYNALSLSPAIRASLFKNWPKGNLLLLHQNWRDEFTCIEPLWIEPRVFSERPRFATTPKSQDCADESLLNWPCEIQPFMSDGRFLCQSHVGLGVNEGPSWRVVFEAHDGEKTLPVTMRSSADAEQRLVCCALLLEPRKKAHAQLLRNFLDFCISGQPVAAISHGPGAQRDAALVREVLNLGGANTVAFEAEADQLDFNKWPLRVVEQAIALGGISLEDLASAPGAENWLSEGGDLMAVDEEKTGKAGQMRVLHGEPDTHALELPR